MTNVLASKLKREMYFDSKPEMQLEGPFFQNITSETESICVINCAETPGCAAYQWNSVSHACSLAHNVSFTVKNTTLVSGFNEEADIELLGDCYDLADGFKYFSSNLALINGEKYNVDPETALTATSYYINTTLHRAACSRLHQELTTSCNGGWNSAVGDSDPWIQADLGQAFYIGGVATQGRARFDQWMTQCSLSYTLGTTFTQYTENGALKVFDANTDRTTVVRNWVAAPFRALRVRLHHVSGTRFVRWELYGRIAGPGDFIKIKKEDTFYCQHLPNCC